MAVGLAGTGWRQTTNDEHAVFGTIIIATTRSGGRNTFLASVTRGNHGDDAFAESQLRDGDHGFVFGTTCVDTGGVVRRTNNITWSKFRNRTEPCGHFPIAIFTGEEGKEVRLGFRDNSSDTNSRLAPITGFIEGRELTEHRSAVVWVANFWNGHHGDAFFDDHIRLPWKVTGFRITAPRDRWDFLTIGIETWDNPTVWRDFHLDAFDVFVASPEGEVENRNLGTTSSEEFITAVDGWVFITSDTPSESIAPCGAGPQTVAFTVVGSCEVHRIGDNRTIDRIAEVGVATIKMSANDWNRRTWCTPQQHGWLPVDSPVAPVFTRLEPAVIGDV